MDDKLIKTRSKNGIYDLAGCLLLLMEYEAKIAHLKNDIKRLKRDMNEYSIKRAQDIAEERLIKDELKLCNPKDITPRLESTK